MNQKSYMERFIELYKSFGIDLKPVEYPDGNGYDIALDNTISNKFGGYSGFGSGVIFDKDGKFMSQEFYE